MPWGTKATCGAGSVRYWLGAGRGGFGISPLECLQTSFYCMVYKAPPLDPTKGWTVKTSPVPIKDPYFATLKSTNYMPNALVALDAQLEGFDQVCHLCCQRMHRGLQHHHDRSWPVHKSRVWSRSHACLLSLTSVGPVLQGVFVDSEGYVAEGPVMNVGVITHEGEMVMPPFEQTLAGVTLQRLMLLVKEVSLAVAVTNRIAMWRRQTPEAHVLLAI